MPVTHLKVSTIPDDPASVAAGEVVPTDWNANHVVNITPAEGGIPTGGNTHQVLTKVTGTNYDVDWETVIPQVDSDPSGPTQQDAWVKHVASGSGGGGQAFGLLMGITQGGGASTHTYGLSYETLQGTIYRVIPEGGTTGDILTKQSAVDFEYDWQTPDAPTQVVLFDHFASQGNSGTSETDLYSDTTAANQLGTNGDKLEAEYGGTFVSSGTATRQIKIYFGGTAIFDTGALTLSLSSAWTIYCTIIRVSSTTIRYMISLMTEGAALSAYTASGSLGGLTLSNTNVLKITGQAAGVGAASNDIVAIMGYVEWKAAA